MDAELKNLRIDRTQRRAAQPSRWATRWIVFGITLFLLLGVARFAYDRVNAATEVEVVRVRNEAGQSGSAANIILNATGYIVAAHKIELASKVVGKVEWIGVEKGNKVRQGQVLVRLED